MREIKRGEIYWIDLGKGEGSVQGGVRPVVVTSNNMCNKFSPVVEVRPITSRLDKNNIPTHVFLSADQYPLHKDSIILAEQAKSVNKTQLGEYICKINELETRKLNRAIAIQSGLIDARSTNNVIAI